MRSKGKVLALILAAMTLVAASIFGTMAYLTDTEAVTNTFTVGNVDIKMDETKIAADGKTAESGRTDEGNEYHLVPGHTYTKNPTVTVLKGSEEAYIRMMVDVKNIDDLKAAIPESKNKDFYADINTNLDGLEFDLRLLLDNSWNFGDWKFVSYTESDKTGTYEFRYLGDAGAWQGSKDDVRLPALFERIKIPGEIVNNEDMKHLAEVEVVVTAQAIQKDGFVGTADKSAEDVAWAAFEAQVDAETTVAP